MADARPLRPERCRRPELLERATQFYRGLRAERREFRSARARAVSLEGSNPIFNELTERSAADIYLLNADTEYGPYPFAGIPWYSTPFGRDGIITAMLMLWLDPTIAKGVLRFLAATQATTADDVKDAKPGKILHEMRNGEMARLGEVPFGRYYGSVDATPLFVMLLGEYFARTGDLDLVRNAMAKCPRSTALDRHRRRSRPRRLRRV